MSIFPTGRSARSWCPPGADRAPGIATEGVLVQPIRGQIYLIEEQDLERLTGDKRRSFPSGLVSRH